MSDPRPLTGRPWLLRRPARLLLVATAVAVVAAVSGCTASSGSGSTARTPSPSSSRAAAASSTASSAAAGASGSAAGGSAAPGGGSPAAGGGAAGTAPAAGTGDLRTAAPVPIADTAAVGGGVTATIARSEAITGEARLPGEIAGPAVRLTVHVNNGGSAPLDLGGVTVDLQDHNGVSATPLTANGAQPFAGALAPGAGADGVYVFTLPTNDRTGVRVLLLFTTSLPVVVFSGDL